jgi:hypothetical protein
MYGDEVGMIGSGGDKAARQDMFPTQVKAWQQEDRLGGPPIGTGSSFDVTGNPVAAHLRALGALRDAVPALSTGAQVTRYAQQGVLALSRFDAAERREYVAVFNAAGSTARVTLPTSTPGSAWAPLLGTTASAASDATGRLTVSVPPLAAVLFRAAATLPARTPPAATVRVAADDLTALEEVRATVATADPVTVTFAMRGPKAARWTRIGIDTSPPYRAFVDLTRVRKGTRMSFVAVVRSSSGAASTSKITTFTVHR